MQTNQKTFGMLAVAYVLSMAYQYYRDILHQHPADTFGLTEATGYGVCLNWACLALVEQIRHRVLLLLSVGVCHPARAVLGLGRSGCLRRIGWAGYRSVAYLAYFRRKQSPPELVRLVR